MSDRQESADDPLGGRSPTSHERLAGLPWDASYHEGPPPWDIAQPQPAILRLESRVTFAGPVLDAGCGTGEHALHLTVLDCGLFHTFDADERALYAASLAAVPEHDGTLYVLCFSDEGPDRGPHPISLDDLRAAFCRANGWSVAAIEPERVHTRFHDDDGAPAWLATIQRISIESAADTDLRGA